MSAAKPMSEAGRVEQANEQAVRASGRASGPVIQSVFLVNLDHGAAVLVVVLLPRLLPLLDPGHSSN